MRGGAPTTAAHNTGTCRDERGDICREFLGAHCENSASIYELGHSRVGLHNKGLMRDGGESLDIREHAVGAEPAVESVSINAESLQKCRDTFD